MSSLNDSKKFLGLVFILASAILFSLGGVFIKFCTWNSMTINGGRCFLAGVVMLIFIKVIGHKIEINKAVIQGAFANSLTNITFVYATKMTTAANAVVLQFTMPIFVILFARLFFKKKPNKSEIMTCIVVFCGVVCFFFDSLSAEGMWGNIIGIASGAFYALVFMQNDFEGGNFESANLFGHALSALVGIPFFINETHYEIDNFLIVAMLGIVILGAGTIFLALGLRKVSSLTAAIISNIEPISNPVWVAIFYDEHLGVFSLIGAVIVIGSVAVYNMMISKEKDK